MILKHELLVIETAYILQILVGSAMNGMLKSTKLWWNQLEQTVLLLKCDDHDYLHLCTSHL